MTIIKEDGTIYKATREGQTVTYCLWGSDDNKHKWSAQFEGDGGNGKFVSLFKNAQTGEEVEDLPEIPVHERKLKIEDKHVMMLQYYFYEIKSVDDPAYKQKPKEEIIQHLIHYNNDVEKIFMMLFALMDRERWPVLYQLIALYADKEPSKLSNIPEILKQYPTEEKQAILMSKLAGKYNDGVAFKQPPPLPTVDPVFKEKLTKFFSIVDPKLVPGVDEMILLLIVEGNSLENYIQQLGLQHPEHAHILGVQPATPAAKDYAAILRAFFQTHSPENLPRIPQLLQQWVGREDSLLQALHDKFKAAAGTSQQQQQQQYITQEEIQKNPYYSRLQEYYGKHNPEKKEAALFELLRNHWGKEEELVAKLVQKYREPFPTEEEADASRKVAEEITEPDENPYKKILVELYQKYNPVKISGIDELLRTYAGTEEELISKIRAKYEGPSASPPPPPPPESTPSSPASASPPSSPKPASSLKQQVHDFFKKHNPERIGHIDLIIKQYTDLGKQDQLLADLHKRYGIQIPPSNTPLTKVLSSLPDPLIYEGIQYDRSVTTDKKVIYTRHDSPTERWLVNEESGVHKYVAVGADDSIGWEKLPNIGSAKASSAATKHTGIMAVPEYSSAFTSTTSIETQDRGSAAVAQQFEDKSSSADLLLGSVDSLFELPPDLATASMQLMEVKEDFIRSAAAEKRLQKEVLTLRARLSEVTGIIESRAHLADPQADAAREMYYDFKKMEKQELIAKTLASETQKALRIKVDQCELLSQENEHLSNQLKTSRNRERKLLKELSTLQSKNQPTDRQGLQSGPSEAMKYKQMQREIFKRDGLLWGLSQDLLNARWTDLDRGFARDECMNTFMTSHLERPVSPTLQDIEVQTTESGTGPSPVQIQQVVDDTTEEVVSRLTSEHQKERQQLLSNLSSEKDAAFDSAVEESFLYKKISSFLQQNAPSHTREKTIAFLKRYWEDATCSEDKLLSLVHEKYKVPYGDTTDFETLKNSYYSSKLQQFYKEHNPAKLSSVDTILKTFSGKEEALMVKLYGTFNVPLDKLEPSPNEIRSSDLFKSIAKTLKMSHPAEVSKTDELTRKLWPARSDHNKIENAFRKKYGVGISWVTDLSCQTDECLPTPPVDNEELSRLSQEYDDLKDIQATANQTIYERDEQISELLASLEAYQQQEEFEYISTAMFAGVLSVVTATAAERFKKVKRRKKSPTRREDSYSPTAEGSPIRSPYSAERSPRSLIRGEKAYSDAISSFQRIKTLTQISLAASGRRSPPRQQSQKMENRPGWKWTS